jgi:hypothetical protein
MVSRGSVYFVSLPEVLGRISFGKGCRMKNSAEEYAVRVVMFFAILALVAGILGGCATTGGLFNDSNTNARILTKGIVAEYLAHNKKSVNVVYKTSSDVLTYVKTGNVSIDQLQVYVMQQITPSVSKLTPEEQVEVTVLIDELKAQLVKQLPANGIDPSKTTLEMVTFFTWINDVAKAYYVIEQNKK